MSLKNDCRRVILDVLKREGMPPIIEKTYGSIWDSFVKTQPHILSFSTSAASSVGLLVENDVWGNLVKSMEKYGIDTKIGQKVVRVLKKKFGENPAPSDIKLLLC